MVWELVPQDALRWTVGKWALNMCLQWIATVPRNLRQELHHYLSDIPSDVTRGTNIVEWWAVCHLSHWFLNHISCIYHPESLQDLSDAHPHCYGCMHNPSNVSPLWTALLCWGRDCNRPPLAPQFWSIQTSAGISVQKSSPVRSFCLFEKDQDQDQDHSEPVLISPEWF